MTHLPSVKLFILMSQPQHSFIMLVIICAFCATHVYYLTSIPPMSGAGFEPASLPLRDNPLKIASSAELDYPLETPPSGIEPDTPFHRGDGFQDRFTPLRSEAKSRWWELNPQPSAYKAGAQPNCASPAERPRQESNLHLSERQHPGSNRRV